MRDGRCTKCGAATVRTARNGIELSESQPNAVLRPHLEPGFRGMVRNHRADVWAYVCLTCGYLELGLYDPAAIAFVTDKWAPVPVAST